MLRFAIPAVMRFARRPSLVLAACLYAAGAVSAPEIPTFNIPTVGKLPTPLQMHGSVVFGDRLYCLGGNGPNGWTNACHSGVIGSDGRVGGWRTELSLPMRLHYVGNGVAAVENRIYIVGGSIAASNAAAASDNTRNDKVLWTSVKPDGSLEPWRQSLFTPRPGLGFLAACSAQGRLYVVGGSLKNDVSKEIYVCDFAADGEPTGWKNAGRMPEPRWFHGTAIAGGRMYVWGGLQLASSKDPDAAVKAVWSAPLASGGEVGEWREERAMPFPVYASAFAADDSFLVSVGGRYRDRSPTNVLWYAPLENGRAGEWKMMKTNLEGRVYTSIAACAATRQICVTGGQTNTLNQPGNPQRTDAVHGFRLSEPK